LEARQTLKQEGASNSRCPNEEIVQARQLPVTRAWGAEEKGPNSKSIGMRPWKQDRTMMNEIESFLFQVPEEGRDLNQIPRRGNR
jgi:hypothetical protein